MFVVIMAGGSGTRFWPVSRQKRPKQFLNISGNDPMVVETCNRLRPVARDEEMIIVLVREHLEEARSLFRDRSVHILAEPVGRNTAPCIGMGAIYARYSGYEGPVAFLPADHYIRDPSAFLKALDQAGKVAEAGGIATLGIVPTRPETGYGYIRKSQPLADFSDFPVYGVSAFVEKPDNEKAHQYLQCGEYLWNAGIFVATPKTIIKEIRQHLPDLHYGLERLKETLGTDSFEKEMERVYNGLEPVSFDYGIMEKTGDPLFVLPCECGWSDVGSWASLYDVRAQDQDNNRNLSEGETLLIDSRNSFVSGRSGRLVACLGIDNCLVVDTPEALLVADLGRSQEIRKVVEQLKKIRKEELL
ncbi:MAG: mannose-1-phosphate guanylyltransferase [Deltaproteobacteria bacterium]|nr:mannose-1-phosphate guanylyltransferase [Deltaproteobacteria bacterium]